MAAQPPTFLLDGKAYNVLVTSHSRSFSILDSEKTGRTADGEMFRDVIGTFYNNKMTIRARANGVGAADLDALWDILSEPTVSHVCTFPYNQGTITQRMYITSGEQALIRLDPDHTQWGEIQLSFVAMSPRRRPK